MKITNFFLLIVILAAANVGAYDELSRATEPTHTSGISASQTYQAYNSNPFITYNRFRYTQPRTVSSSSSSCQCSNEVNSSGGNCTRTHQGRRWCYLNTNYYSSYRCPDVKYSRSNKPWSFIGCQYSG